MKHAAEAENRAFVVRQFGSLVAAGLTEAEALVCLREALGDAALAGLEGDSLPDSPEVRGGSDALVAAAEVGGGSAAVARVAYAQLCGEARVLALAWWRPARTFLLYATVLLAAAVSLAANFVVFLLPRFAGFATMMGASRGGVAGWILSFGAIRLFGPLALLALLIVALASLLFTARRRIAALNPLPFAVSGTWPYGRSGRHYRVLRVLEYAAVLHEAGVAAAESLEQALRLVRWPGGKPLAEGHARLGQWLEQSIQLDTFRAELDWQRERAWNELQSSLELARDRTLLLARIVFYGLIGYLVVILYLPIFSLARTTGGI